MSAIPEGYLTAASTLEALRRQVPEHLERFLAHARESSALRGHFSRGRMHVLTTRGSRVGMQR